MVLLVTETRHFTWRSIGNDADHARALLVAALVLHTELQTHEIDGIVESAWTIDLKPGTVLRDDTELTNPGAREGYTNGDTP